MAGNQSKALVIVSRARGWDPTVIPAGNGRPEESLVNWDKSPTPAGLGDYCVGTLPGGTPDGWPDTAGMPNPDPSARDFEIPSGHDTPQGPSRRTTNADPYAGQ